MGDAWFKTKNSSGGFLSVDREQAIKENWEEIQKMKRPANMDARAPTPGQLKELENYRRYFSERNTLQPDRIEWLLGQLERAWNIKGEK